MPKTGAKKDCSRPLVTLPFCFVRPFPNLLCSNSSRMTDFWLTVCKSRSAKQLLEKILCPPHTPPSHCWLALFTLPCGDIGVRA